MVGQLHSKSKPPKVTSNPESLAMWRVQQDIENAIKELDDFLDEYGYVGYGHGGLLGGAKKSLQMVYDEMERLKNHNDANPGRSLLYARELSRRVKLVIH